MLDSDFEILDNDGVYDSGLGLVFVTEAASYIEISGEAVPAAEEPFVTLDALSFDQGTYLVGTDIQPGRYRVSDTDYAYAARLAPTDTGWDIVDNEGNEGSVIIEIVEGDFAFQFSGTIEPI